MQAHINVCCQVCFVSRMFCVKYRNELRTQHVCGNVRRNHLNRCSEKPLVCFVSSMFCVKYVLCEVCSDGATNNQYQHGMPANEYNYITQRHQECDHQKLWRSHTSAGVHLAHHARSSSTSVLAAIRTTGHLRSGLRRRQVAASRGARQFCVEHTGCRANQASKQ